MTNKVTAYKAFNADMTCRAFKFEVGATYEHQGSVEICNSGFHACTVPFDCWSYYNDSHTFARVTAENPQTHDEDSKIVTGRLTIEASLNLPAWIKVQVASVVELCRSATGSLTSGYGAHAASTGYRAHAASTGDYAHAASTGDYAHAASTGDYAHAASTGDYAHAASTGYRARASAKGKDACGVAFDIAGRAAAGENGLVIVGWRDAQERHRVTVGYVGENGIKAGTWYTADEAGNLIEQGAVE